MKVPPDFYCCYLLQSQPKPKSFYIGSTPDPVRRLRQHNGFLAQGAWKTKSEAKRPWRMACLVTGFQSQVASLQFEHAWQHAYQTRHIPPEQRIAASRQQMYSSIDKHMGHLRLLLRADSFARLPLKVYILEQPALTAWTLNKYRVDGQPEAMVDVRRDDDVAEVGSQGPNQVVIGGGLLRANLASMKSRSSSTQPDRSQLLAKCPECQFTSPLGELAEKLLADEPGQVIPTRGKCPQCSADMAWHDIVKASLGPESD